MVLGGIRCLSGSWKVEVPRYGGEVPRGPRIRDGRARRWADGAAQPPGEGNFSGSLLLDASEGKKP